MAGEANAGPRDVGTLEWAGRHFLYPVGTGWTGGPGAAKKQPGLAGVNKGAVGEA